MLSEKRRHIEQAPREKRRTYSHRVGVPQFMLVACLDGIESPTLKEFACRQTIEELKDIADIPSIDNPTLDRKPIWGWVVESGQWQPTDEEPVWVTGEYELLGTLNEESAPTWEALR